MVTTKVSPVLHYFTSSVKKSLIQQEQDNEKEETTKKSNETLHEKEFALFFSTNKRLFQTPIQTQHNTTYINNYKSSFYALITTPPPDTFALIFILSIL